MATVKNFYRILISLASILSFFFGWFFLAHSLKPVQPSSPSQVFQGSQSEQLSLPTLEPLNFNKQRRSFLTNPGFQQPSFSTPRFRSGGS